MGMQELSQQGELQKSYAEALKYFQEKIPNIESVRVDVSVDGSDLILAIGEHQLYMTPEQAVDLMQEIRRAVVKVKPKALRPKRLRHR